VSIDSLFDGKDGELILAFDKLLSEIVDWENVVVSATQNCVVFVHRQTFLIIRPLKKQLDIKFYTEKEQVDFPVLKSIFYSGKYENHIRISNASEISEGVFFLIKQSYKLL
jgi:hypothetical protein